MNGQTLLFWPATPSNYILQSTCDFRSTNWVWAGDAVPTTNGADTAVTVANISASRFFRLLEVEMTTSDGMAFIPAGPFLMGDSLDGERDATPTVMPNLSPFYMDTNLVSFTLW
jgi:formylglycine-generating enzyme required for sulfatase activity